MAKITDIIKNIDVDDLRFMMKTPRLSFLGILSLAMSSDSDSVWQECIVDQSRYKVCDGYKITLRPIDCNYKIKSFYQSDFNDSLKNGNIKQIVNHSLKKAETKND